MKIRFLLLFLLCHECLTAQFFTKLDLEAGKPDPIYTLTNKEKYSVYDLRFSINYILLKKSKSSFYGGIGYGMAYQNNALFWIKYNENNITARGIKSFYHSKLFIPLGVRYTISKRFYANALLNTEINIKKRVDYPFGDYELDFGPFNSFDLQGGMGFKTGRFSILPYIRLVSVKPTDEYIFDLKFVDKLIGEEAKKRFIEQIDKPLNLSNPIRVGLSLLYEI
jgi:hypothetical protein